MNTFTYKRPFSVRGVYAIKNGRYYREPCLLFLEGELRSFSESVQQSLPTAVDLQNVHAHSRLIRVINGRQVYISFQSRRPEFYASVFKRDNPAVNISHCILYTTADESLFEKKHIFTSKSGSKEVVLLEDE